MVNSFTLIVIGGPIALGLIIWLISRAPDNNRDNVAQATRDPLESHEEDYY